MLSTVDCLARTGHLEDVEKFINDMPMEPDQAVVGAILTRRRVHNNVEVGEEIAKKLVYFYRTCKQQWVDSMRLR